RLRRLLDVVTDGTAAVAGIALDDDAEDLVRVGRGGVRETGRECGLSMRRGRSDQQRRQRGGDHDRLQAPKPRRRRLTAVAAAKFQAGSLSFRAEARG